MASEVGSAAVNGLHHASNGTSSHSPASSGSTDISKEEVAWYFVEQYYTTLSRTPDKLYLFFNKRSQYVSGVEDEKVSVCIGQKAINERIKDLEFSETKVRVTNVDSQASDSNIVIQVIGEMSNKSQPHKKFVQTFVLATQTNGYFVLNDIFRYIKDDDEEELPSSGAGVPAEAATGGYVEPSHSTEESSTKEVVVPKATVTSDEAVAEVDKGLEQVIKEDEQSANDVRPSSKVNGSLAHDEAPVAHAEETTAAAVASTETAKEEAPKVPATEELDVEKPLDPAPSPVPAAKPKPAVSNAAPPKPAVPKTWAQLASSTRAGAAAAAAAAAAPTPAAPAAQPKALTPTASQSQSAAPASAAPAAAAAAVPVREPSPDSQKSGSQGGWQTAGADHARKGSRVVPPAASDSGRVRAYVKNVTTAITNEELKAHLSQFGELVYFDVNRPKNAAFAEFATKAAFDAAVAANPHKIKNESLYVEERRMQPGQFTRGGGAMRGRGGFDGRPPAGRGGFKQDGPGGPGRGGFGGRGRGNGAPRGRGGGPQAA